MGIAEKKIWVEGHRGWCAKYPENTLVSFKAAIEYGVDVFEFDVHLTKDKVPVIMHDANAYRTCGVDRLLKDMTLEEVKQLDAGKKFSPEFEGERVPTLKETLELVKSLSDTVRLGVEIKDYSEENVDLTVALLKEYGFFEDCWFYCFNARILKYIKQRYNGRTMGYPDFQMSDFEPDSYDYYDEMGISMNVARSEVYDVYAGKGKPMHIFCADTEEAVAFALSKAPALITANDPPALMKALGRI
ncbi:MAG: glycerophosphodiester phosphodiesterase [Ruminococcaceae bacterium]|nr:glycerophosphodiester phosphodiesterase [Oscillospiraceae bacterium]